MSDYPFRIVGQVDQAVPAELPVELPVAMIDQPAAAVTTPASQNAASANDKEQMAELRQLLLQPEQERIAQLETRINDHRERAKDLSRLLPDAIRQRNIHDNALDFALQPNIGPLLKQAIKNDPTTVIDAVSPIIGPAIRQAIAKALNEFVQSMDETMKYSVSSQGLKWRVEALTTGRPFSEVVMYHTLLYRVEQAFLFHRKTGLLLQHVAAPNAKSKDADMISGLLTAINDFARESFKAHENQNLLKLDYGDLEVWIEGGTPPVELAYIAVVINGNAPETLRTEILLPALEAVHADQRESLLNFDGDTESFKMAVPHLEACLTSQSRGKASISAAKQGFRLPPTLAVPLAILALALLTWGFFNWRAQRRWNEYLAKLAAEPGLIITNQARRNDIFLRNHFMVEGLRDPLAIDPAKILATSTTLDPQYVTQTWKPFHALNPQFIRLRANHVLEPPASVTLDVQEGVLVATGTANHDWITTARRLARALPGVDRFDESGLLDERLLQLKQLQAVLENNQLLFTSGTANFSNASGPELTKLARSVREMLTLAQSAQKTMLVEIVGSTDDQGNLTFNQQLSVARAQRMLEELVTRGVPRAILKATGIGIGASSTHTPEERQRSRKVAFKITLNDAQPTTITAQSKGSS